VSRSLGFGITHRKPVRYRHQLVIHVTGLVSAHREPVAVIGGTCGCDMPHRAYARG